MAKAFDNRAGCLVAVETLKALQDVSHPNVVYSGATVQEEVGIRGAQTSATMIQSDVYIALDVTCAMDTPGIEANDDDPKVGLGPVIIIYDSGLITNTKLRDLFIDTAEEEGIPYQTEVCIYDGGTDAESAHVTGYGVPSINIGFHHDDLENTVKLLTAVLKKLDQKTVDWIKS
ncbi:hypothetical protein [Brevibacillus sp. NRS-1366]|uniref:hypothetical protein n=1 Tax=Brevibacillus sp. NRS-1366 TaxID=3233899 RepID=UPI003D25A675